VVKLNKVCLSPIVDFFFTANISIQYPLSRQFLQPLARPYKFYFGSVEPSEFDVINTMG